jgi:hypothetical protein
MRYSLIVTALYLAAMTCFVYGVLDREVDPSAAWLPVVVLAQLAVGFLIGRWPAVVLPVIVVVISIPAGYPPFEEGEPLPLWFGLAYGAVFAVPLVTIGVLVRKLFDWRGRVQAQGAE